MSQQQYIAKHHGKIVFSGTITPCPLGTSYAELRERIVNSQHNPSELFIEIQGEIFKVKNKDGEIKEIPYSTRASLFLKAIGNTKNWRNELPLVKNMKTYIALSALDGTSNYKKRNEKKNKPTIQVSAAA